MYEIKRFFTLTGGGELVEKLFVFSEEYLMGRLKKECLDYIVKFLKSTNPAVGDVLRFHFLACRFDLAEVKKMTTHILQNTSMTQLEKCDNFTMVGLEEVFFNKIKHMETLMRTTKTTISGFFVSLENCLHNRCKGHRRYGYEDCLTCANLRISSVEGTIKSYVYNGEARGTAEARKSCLITNIQDQYDKCLGQGGGCF